MSRSTWALIAVLLVGRFAAAAAPSTDSASDATRSSAPSYAPQAWRAPPAATAWGKVPRRLDMMAYKKPSSATPVTRTAQLRQPRVQPDVKPSESPFEDVPDTAEPQPAQRDIFAPPPEEEPMPMPMPDALPAEPPAEFAPRATPMPDEPMPSAEPMPEEPAPRAAPIPDEPLPAAEPMPDESMPPAMEESPFDESPFEEAKPPAHEPMPTPAPSTPRRAAPPSSAPPRVAPAPRAPSRTPSPSTTPRPTPAPSAPPRMSEPRAPSMAPPSRSNRSEAPEALPPATQRAPSQRESNPEPWPLQPEPEQIDSGAAGEYREFSDFGDTLGYDEFGGCESCGDCASCGGAPGGTYWDHVIPPAGFHVPRGTWASVDYLMWWSRGASLPALVTTGSQTGTFAGSMSDPNVRVLFGDERVDTGLRSGGRLNVGTWFDCEQTLGVGGSFIGLQSVGTDYVATSAGDPLLARPFFDTSTNSNNAEIIAQTGNTSGAIFAQTSSKFVAADVYFRKALSFAPRRRLDLLYGYRYLQVGDSLSIDDRTVSTDPFNPQVPLGTIVRGHDAFSANNQFNGFQMGFMGERRRGIWSISTMGKISLGNMHQFVSISGENSVTEPNGSSSHSAGSLLAQPSNIGRYSRNVFAVVPEATINLGCNITPRLRATFGYSVIYVNRVAQSARQIDWGIDPNQFGGSSAAVWPAFSFQQNGFWLQGVNFGLNYRF